MMMTQATLSPPRSTRKPANGKPTAGKPTAGERPVSQEIERRLLREIPVALIDVNPRNVRAADAADTADLTGTIKQVGILQPVNVRPKGDRYELVSGERRLFAARAAKCATIPAIVREWSEAQALVAMVAENLCRKALNPLERAKSLDMLMRPVDDGGAGKSLEQVCKLFNKSRSWVINTSRLLLLPEVWQQRINRGEINERQARSLIAHVDDAAVMERIERDREQRPECWQTAEAFAESVKFIVAHGDAAIDAPRPTLPPMKSTAKSAAKTKGKPAQGRRDEPQGDGDDDGDDHDGGPDDPRDEAAATGDAATVAGDVERAGYAEHERVHVVLSEAEFQHILTSMAAGAQLYDQLAHLANPNDAENAEDKRREAEYVRLNAETHRVLTKLYGAASIEVTPNEK